MSLRVIAAHSRGNIIETKRVYRLPYLPVIQIETQGKNLWDAEKHVYAASSNCSENVFWQIVVRVAHSMSQIG